MGNKVSAPTSEDFSRPHTLLQPPFSEVLYPAALEEGLSFTLPKVAWTRGCVVPELGIKIIPDDSAKFYQGSKCFVFKTVPNGGNDRLVAVLSSYDSFRVRIHTPTQPYPTAPVKDDYQGQALYEYAVVTKKRDSTQHLLHFPWLSHSTGGRNGGGGDDNQALPPARLVTAKFYVKGQRHRIVHPWDSRADMWSVIYEQADNTTWRVQTATGVDPLLVLSFVLSTDRFVQYVDNQHLRRTALLDVSTKVGGKA